MFPGSAIFSFAQGYAMGYEPPCEAPLIPIRPAMVDPVSWSCKMGGMTGKKRDSSAMRAAAAMSGAVDLSGLKKPPSQPASPFVGAGGGASKPPVSPAPSSTGPSGSAVNTDSAHRSGGARIVDVTEANFPDVLQLSSSALVVIVIGASYSPDSVTLIANLKQINAEYGGAWVLATVDKDRAPTVADAFRVQSVPTTAAVVGGRPVSAFAGSQTTDQLAAWFDELYKALPPEFSAGVSKPEAEADPRIVAAEDLLAQGNFAAAEQAYRDILKAEPANNDAKAALVQVAFLSRTQDIDASVVTSADADPRNVDAACVAADYEVLIGQYEQAYNRLLELVRTTSGDDRSRAKDHLVSLIELLDPKDPLVKKTRMKLASALF